MFKKSLGISVYPEFLETKEIEDYLKICKENNFDRIFLSLIHFNNDELQENFEIYKETIKKANKMNYYIVLDVVENVFDYLNIDKNNLQPFAEIGVNCLRLDSPMLPQQISKMTYNDYDIDFQINMSNNDSFINNILDYRPKVDSLFGCHNFYPLQNSGLSFENFCNSSERFKKLGIHTSAFVGSQTGNRGPQKAEVGPLVSCELIRNLPIRSQAKLLWKTDLISSIYVGNQKMSDEEIKELGSLMKVKKTQFDLIKTPELKTDYSKIINFDNHFWRGDASEIFVRSTQTRVSFNEIIKPESTPNLLNFGDVCIINSNNSHYQKELIIILKNNFENTNNSLNLVGKIADYDLELLKLLKPWDSFSFRTL